MNGKCSKSNNEREERRGEGIELCKIKDEKKGFSLPFQWALKKLAFVIVSASFTQLRAMFISKSIPPVRWNAACALESRDKHLSPHKREKLNKHTNYFSHKFLKKRNKDLLFYLQIFIDLLSKKTNICQSSSFPPFSFFYSLDCTTPSTNKRSTRWKSSNCRRNHKDCSLSNYNLSVLCIRSYLCNFLASFDLCFLR